VAQLQKTLNTEL
jgi:chromosome segregation ATPase